MLHIRTHATGLITDDADTVDKNKEQDQEKDKQQYVNRYFTVEEYATFSFFVLIGSANKHESGEINPVFKAKLVHDHGALFHVLRRRIGNVKHKNPAVIPDNYVRPWEILWDFGSEKPYAVAHSLQNTNHMKSTQVETYRPLSMITKLPDGKELVFFGIQL